MRLHIYQIHRRAVKTSAPFPVIAAVVLLLTACLPTSPTPSATPPSPTPECTGHTASVTLSASETTITVGDDVTVTITVDNPGCTALGLPRYQLHTPSPDQEAIFDPAGLEPVTVYGAVPAGGTDTAEFVLTAVQPGVITLTASVSFEVHLGYPGPAYWGGEQTPDFLTIRVKR